MNWSHIEGPGSHAQQRGVWVAHMKASATGNAESVAEHAILLLLALCRKLPQALRGVTRGEWAQPQGTALSGRTACIVGLGDIGTALAVRLRAFGMLLNTPPAPRQPLT